MRLGPVSMKTLKQPWFYSSKYTLPLTPRLSPNAWGSSRGGAVRMRSLRALGQVVNTAARGCTVCVRQSAGVKRCTSGPAVERQLR